MAGINQVLNTAKLGLSAQQLGLNVTGHNIANVNNPDFSRQSVPQVATSPLKQYGFLIGSGVDSQQIRQSADQLLEDRISAQTSSFSAKEVFMAYMKTLGSIFDEGAESSLSRILPSFWDSWNTLSNNPSGAAERMNVYENANKLAERFSLMDADLYKLEQDLNKDIEAGVKEVNRISSEIARLNQAIMAQEHGRNANDSRDLRNSLVKELSSWIDVKTFESSNSSLTITTGEGFPLVSGNSFYSLKFENKQVKWESTSGGYVDISDRIMGGALGGWLEMRDVELPRYRQEIDALAREVIWNVNSIHAKGAGLSYIDADISSAYKPRVGNWLASLPYGDRIDYTEDLVLWVQNNETSPPSYTKKIIDMDISSAKPLNWSGSAPGMDKFLYEFEVVRSGTTGENIWLSDGAGLGQIQLADSLRVALDKALSQQTLTITDSSGRETRLEIGQSNGDIPPSAYAISQALNDIDGLQSFASENQIVFDISDLLLGVGDMQVHDEVHFTLISGSTREELVFFIGETAADTRLNFENALNSVVSGVDDLKLSYDPLSPDNFTLKSISGENLAIESFKIIDNASITLDNFLNDSAGPGTAYINIAGVDISFYLDDSDQIATANNLFTALNRESTALIEAGLSWEINSSSDGVNIWASNGGDLDILAFETYGGNGDGGLDLSSLNGTLVNGVDAGSASISASSFLEVLVSADSLATGRLDVDGALLSTAGLDSCVKVSTINIFAAPGMSISSDATNPYGSLFNVSANTIPPYANAILTLGGDGGFSGFNPGDSISFDIDGVSVNYLVDPLHISDEDFAGGLMEALKVAGLDPSIYSFVKTGREISILKNNGELIELSSFSSLPTASASLKARTGNGFGLEGYSSVDLQDGGTNGLKSAVFGTGAAIEWRKYDSEGHYTGVSGRIDVQDSGPYTVEGDLSFDLSPGSLVAGNTFSVNTDKNGRVSLLDMDIKGRAGSINDSYIVSVKAPGGAIGEDDITLVWESRYSSGELTIEYDPRMPPPVYLELDGMRLALNKGELFQDDIFIIETDSSGKGKLLASSDFHWTTESFAREFNRKGEGISAKVLKDGSLSFSPKDRSFELSDLGCSGSNGFCDVNTSLKIMDSTALSEQTMDFRIARDEFGNWSIENDYTSGIASIIPAGGDDSGFGIDLTGDGLADILLNFDRSVTGSGFLEFDIVPRKSEAYAFAFSGEDGNSGSLASALGLNTFFDGKDARSITVNERMAELDNINSGFLDSSNGELRNGDNSIARALSDLQDKLIKFEEWHFSRNGKAVSAQADASLEVYYQMMVTAVGVRYQTELGSMNFHATMLSNLSYQRDSLSAVSLDEEMINLIKYQQAFTAAAKLVTVSDEMLSTLVNMR